MKRLIIVSAKLTDYPLTLNCSQGGSLFLTFIKVEALLLFLCNIIFEISHSCGQLNSDNVAQLDLTVLGKPIQLNHMISEQRKKELLSHYLYSCSNEKEISTKNVVHLVKKSYWFITPLLGNKNQPRSSLFTWTTKHSPRN